MTDSPDRSSGAPAADKLLFTPGPLTTSASTKRAMLRDLGSRDVEFVALVRDARRRLLELAGAGPGAGYEAVLLQGSGTYGIEAMVTTLVPRDGRLLVLANGAYGARIGLVARVHGIDVRVETRPEDTPFRGAEVGDWLRADAGVTHVAVVHCETTTGLMNPIAEVAAAVHAAGRRCLIDSMSAFGAVPVDLPALAVDALVSSSNKCIEGVPGFAFALVRQAALLEAEGQARTLTLDLVAQWRGLERDGQFRFTPPTHVLLAFAQALRELEAEGGVAGRGARYARNQAAVQVGLEALGFRSYLPAAVQGPIITTFRYPQDPKFDFAAFYRRLSDRGFVIYPGKLTAEPCFRVGSVGRIGEPEIRGLLAAVAEVVREMGFDPAA
ncbi:MAG: 2-aminoethylphosphonate--pyruvate transaminase [Planctomycetota bacterium]